MHLSLTANLEAQTAAPADSERTYRPSRRLRLEDGSRRYEREMKTNLRLVSAKALGGIAGVFEGLVNNAVSEETHSGIDRGRTKRLRTVGQAGAYDVSVVPDCRPEYSVGALRR